MFQWGQSIEDTSGYRIDSLSASVGALNVPVGAEYGRHIWLQNRQFVSFSGGSECSSGGRVWKTHLVTESTVCQLQWGL